VLLFDRNRDSTRLTAAGRRFSDDRISLKGALKLPPCTARRANPERRGPCLGFQIPVANTLELLPPRCVKFLAAGCANCRTSLKECQTIDHFEALPQA